MCICTTCACSVFSFTRISALIECACVCVSVYELCGREREEGTESMGSVHQLFLAINLL